MKNYIYIVLIIILSPIMLVGQLVCPSDPILTDPDVTGGWDWRQDPLTIFEHIQATGQNQYSPFPNPFFNFTNANTGFLAQEGPAPLFEDLRDYQPSDGWELIYKQVADEETPGRGVTHPVIILYNKFRGVLRAFINISDKDADYNGAVIKLEILNDQILTGSPSLVGNANLSLASPIAQPLDNFTHDHSMVKINEWEEQDDYWLYAEFPIGYDPCVCLYESRFYIEAVLIRDGTLEWVSGGKAPTTKKIVDGGKDDKSLKETYETVSKFANGASKAANTGKKSATETVKMITSILKLVNSVNSISTKDAKTTEEKELAEKSTFKVPEWLKIIPEVALAFNVIEFLITGPDDKKTTTVGTQAIETKGSLNFTSNFKNSTPIIPGAQKGTAVQQYVPEYNNPLGVFNLLKTPELEYVEYLPNVQEVTYFDPNISFTGTLPFPRIREYIVKENLEYTLNPHAEVDIINMDVSLVYVPKIKRIIGLPCPNSKGIVTPMNAYINGPVELGRYDTDLSYENRLFLQDIVLNYGPTTLEDNLEGAIYSTPPKSKDCFRYTKFKVFHWESLGETDIKCRITLTLKPKNSDKEFVTIHTYPVNTSLSPLNKKEGEVAVRDDDGNLTGTAIKRISSRVYYFEDVASGTKFLRRVSEEGDCEPNFPIASIDPSPFINNYDIPSNVVVSDVHLTSNQTIKAWNSVIIGENVTADPNVKLTLQAGNNINFTNNANINFDFETILANPASCPVVDEVSVDELNAFCSSKKYQDMTALKKQEIRTDNINDFNQNIILKNYPNPFENDMTIEFEIKESTMLSLTITNSLGQNIETLIDNSLIDGGTHKISYNGSDLPSGMYFAILQGKSFKKTIKIIKQ